MRGIKAKDIRTEIAKGTFSRVYRIGSTGTVAKVTKGDDFASSVKDICVVNSLCHPNIIKYNKVEFLSCNDTVVYMNLHTQFGYSSIGSIKQLLTTFTELLSAISYLHCRGIIHCDIKPANLLRDNSGRLLLCDFNTAQLVNTTGYYNSKVQTVNYRAPEIDFSRQKSQYTTAIDMWSTGCMLYEAVAGKTSTTRLYFNARPEFADTTIPICGVFGIHNVKSRQERLTLLYGLSVDKIADTIRKPIMAGFMQFSDCTEYMHIAESIIRLTGVLLTPNPKQRYGAQQALMVLAETAGITIENGGLTLPDVSGITTDVCMSGIAEQFTKKVPGELMHPAVRLYNKTKLKCYCIEQHLCNLCKISDNMLLQIAVYYISILYGRVNDVISLFTCTLQQLNIGVKIIMKLFDYNPLPEIT